MRSWASATLLAACLPFVGAVLACSGDAGNGDSGTLGDGDGDGDGEDAGPVSCDGAAAGEGIEVGKSGLDFEAFAPGEKLRSWIRPQGGIGTRINVRILGFSEETDFASLLTEIFLRPTGTGAPGAVGGDCIDGGCNTGLGCFEDTCRVLVTDQSYGMFPRDCLDDGSLHVPEMSILYKIGLNLDDLDGEMVDVRETITPAGGVGVSTTTELEIEVGDFVQPSWWDQ